MDSQHIVKAFLFVIFCPLNGFVIATYRSTDIASNMYIDVNPRKNTMKPSMLHPRFPHSQRCAYVDVIASGQPETK